MNHILLALLFQFVLAPLSWWLGAFFVIGYYLGREMAQAEYRVIQNFYAGKRANMPWWGAFQSKAWNIKSILDWVLPSIAVIIVALLALVLK
jgi:hypothetical protein